MSRDREEESLLCRRCKNYTVQYPGDLCRTCERNEEGYLRERAEYNRKVSSGWDPQNPDGY
jgi:hypothetical protein